MPPTGQLVCPAHPMQKPHLRAGMILSSSATFGLSRASSSSAMKSFGSVLIGAAHWAGALIGAGPESIHAEAQARIAELEQALRRAELDARDTVHRVELQADERRLDEARKFQLQVSELQNELRLERLRQGGAQPDDLAQDSLAQQLALREQQLLGRPTCEPSAPFHTSARAY